MYARIALLAAVLAVTPLAHADESVAGLARETGLTERNVRMLLGARTAYPEYRIVYNRVDREFKEAIGEVRYERLTGRPAKPANAHDATEIRVAVRKEEAKGNVATL